jgi:hypothetical protein
MISNYNGRCFLKPWDTGVQTRFQTGTCAFAWQPFYSDLDSQATSVLLTASI